MYSEIRTQILCTEIIKILSVLLKFNSGMWSKDVTQRVAQGNDPVESIAVILHFPGLRDVGFLPPLCSNFINIAFLFHYWSTSASKRLWKSYSYLAQGPMVSFLSIKYRDT